MNAAEIVNTRVFSQPREEVFHVFSDPARLARWWGPAGFTNKIHAFDLRAGGEWRIDMHAPTGAVYPNTSRFVEVRAPELIVFEHLGPMHWYHMTMAYVIEGAGTRVTWRMRFASVEETEKLGEFIAAANEQNFDRLAAELGRVATN